MGEKTEDERREKGGYGSEEVSRTSEPSEAERERAAKLADLRERKAKLLEAKAQAAKLLEAKERADKLAAKEKERAEYEEHYANLEDGRQRALRGFALKQHAANLAEAKKREREAKLLGAQEEKSRANASGSHDQDTSKVMQPDKKERDTEVQEPNEQDVRACTSDSGDDRQEAGEDEEESEEEDGVDSSDEETNEASVALGRCAASRLETVPPREYLCAPKDIDDDCPETIFVPGGSDPSLSHLLYKKTRSVAEQTEDQKEETERRRQQATFVASKPAKIKSINRKGHHAFGRVSKGRLLTGTKS